MKTIGFGASHNSSAALMIDGRIVGAIQEERLSRRKNQLAYPRLAIDALVAQHCGGRFDAIERVVMGGREVDLHCVAIDRYSDYRVRDFLRELHEYWHPQRGAARSTQYWVDLYRSGLNRNPSHNYDLSFIDEMTWEEAEQTFRTREQLGVVTRHFKCPLPTATVDHHACHAYYALYGSELAADAIRDALVLTADAWGDGINWSASVPTSSGRLERIGCGSDHRVAFLYKFTTLVLGMTPNRDEHKVMGLAPYCAEGLEVTAVERVFFDALDFRNGAFTSAAPLNDPYFDLRQRLEGFRFDHIAAGVQNWATRVVLAWASHWLTLTQKRVLCLSGGLSMNVRLNGELRMLPALRTLAVPASGGDESLAIGACYADALAAGAEVVPMTHVYLGGIARASQWHDHVKIAGGNPDDYDAIDDFDDVGVARLLAANEIVARCVGRAEFGSRALGNRSILAHPSHRSNVRIINSVVKRRDFWMPFALSILDGYVAEYVDIAKCSTTEFMTIAFPTFAGRCDEIAAGLHPADLSSRIQVVRRDIAPDFWQLLDRFRQLTGVPALLNTSLNLHGEPMNYDASDAIRTLVRSSLEFLVLPDKTLVYRRTAFDRLNEAQARLTAPPPVSSLRAPLPPEILTAE